MPCTIDLWQEVLLPGKSLGDLLFKIRKMMLLVACNSHRILVAGPSRSHWRKSLISAVDHWLVRSQTSNCWMKASSEVETPYLLGFLKWRGRSSVYLFWSSDPSHLWSILERFLVRICSFICLPVPGCSKLDPTRLISGQQWSNGLRVDGWWYWLLSFTLIWCWSLFSQPSLLSLNRYGISLNSTWVIDHGVLSWFGLCPSVISVIRRFTSPSPVIMRSDRRSNVSIVTQIFEHLKHLSVTISMEDVFI